MDTSGQEILNSNSSYFAAPLGKLARARWDLVRSRRTQGQERTFAKPYDEDISVRSGALIRMA
jgi:hypothetical protein